jgi:hypothetical protein
MRLYIASDRITLVETGGWRQKPLRTRSMAVSGKPVKALAELLVGKALPIRIYLSNHFVQLLALPWQEALDSEAEWEAFARQALKTAYGRDDILVRLAMQGYGSPVLAVGVETAFHDELAETVKATGCTLKSLEPAATAAFDAHRKRLSPDGWFFAAQPGMLAGMRLREGRIASASMHPLEADWSGSVQAAIQRELVKHGDTESTVFLHAAAPVSLASLPGLTVLAAGRDERVGLAA